MKCTVCGRNYVRSYCDFCSREKRWCSAKYGGAFTPRIHKDLKLIDILVGQDELMHVRKGAGLYLRGPVGCGKSLYASQLMIESMRLTFIEQKGPREHAFVTVPDLLDKLRQAINDAVPFNWIGYYSNIDFLVLDDLGVEKITDWTLEKLYQLINFRYEHLKSTIFTSNLTGDELAARLGDRIPSRMNQMCMVKEFKEIDYRI